MHCTSISVHGPCCLGQSLAEAPRHVPGRHSGALPLQGLPSGGGGHSWAAWGSLGHRHYACSSRRAIKTIFYRLGPCCKYGERQERPRTVCTAWGHLLLPSWQAAHRSPSQTPRGWQLGCPLQGAQEETRDSRAPAPACQPALETQFDSTGLLSKSRFQP